MKSYLTIFFFLAIPLFLIAQPCTVDDATGCVCEDGSTDCLLLPNIKVAYDLLVDPYSNPEHANLLRVSVSTPNVGHGPLRVIATNNFVCGTDTLFNTSINVCPDGSTPRQLVQQRIYKKTGNDMSFIDRWAGTMTYHPTHNHSHFDDWGIYTLRIPDPGEPDPLKWTIVGQGAKLGFCLMDYGSCEYYDGHCRDDDNNRLTIDAPNYGLGGGTYSCGTSNQGISCGWTDIYYHNLSGMSVEIPDNTCNGDYMVVVQIDPNNYLLEENKTDNIMVAPITLTKQTDPADLPPPTTAISVNGATEICYGEQTELSVPRTGSAYLWSNGAATATIMVDESGTYICEVTTPCGTAISEPVVIGLGEACPPPGIRAKFDYYRFDEDNILTGNLMDNDFPVNGLDLFTVANTLPNHGTLTLQNDGTFSYLPDLNFSGADSFEYHLCSPTIIPCPKATVTISITPINDAPVATPDTMRTLAGEKLISYVIGNDSDVENNSLAAYPLSNININGKLFILQSGYISYTPDLDFVGTEEVMYQVCDTGSPSACDTTKVVLISEQSCIDIELHAYLEGAYNSSTGEMTTTLNSNRHLLPGQTPVSPLATPTPAGHPYYPAPWNYNGFEGANWTDADYAADVVDWLLVSFREGIAKNTEVLRTAALLHKDGRVSFPDRCALSVTLGADSLYVVVEHRNHIGVMSPNPVPISDFLFAYDFRTTDSYKDPTSYGQKLLPFGVWCMYAGDGNQTADVQSYDINGSDKSIWVGDNGKFDYYRLTDFNLDGDVNGTDKSIWFDNNGISSRVPK